jgi:hypothetical protein
MHNSARGVPTMSALLVLKAVPMAKRCDRNFECPEAKKKGSNHGGRRMCGRFKAAGSASNQSPVSDSVEQVEVSLESKSSSANWRLARALSHTSRQPFSLLVDECRSVGL